jgi:hypothetical protein
MLLKDLQQPLSEALQRMLERPAIMQPFVVVDVVGSEDFVQFMETEDHLLQFECPPHGTMVQFGCSNKGACTCIPGCTIPLCLSIRTAAFAAQYLREQFELPPETELLIDENPSPELAS